MGILSWIIFGALAGWMASMVMGRNNQMGCLANIVVGIIGAVVGGWIMSFFGKAGVTGFDLVSFVVAVIGAVVFLGILNLLTGRRR
ncbi:MAG: GlsB/YeaQ/YmgE family stress response membrane protein [Chloroflexi bacterium]|nr:GlsB/YeaQ/YmgE family stress response membrane protein [Chloroflexota bacterium]MBK8935853.1 GlsB/YeaQ/YmgE family stress response membrane protein [Chloroflexota bacterium]